jgi:hypothetical protein
MLMALGFLARKDFYFISLLNSVVFVFYDKKIFPKRVVCTKFAIYLFVSYRETQRY